MLQINNIANITKSMPDKFLSMHVRYQSQYTLQSLIVNVRCRSLLQRYKSEMCRPKCTKSVRPKLCVAHQDISLKTGLSQEKRNVWEPYSYVLRLVFRLLVSVNASSLPTNLNLTRSSTNNFLQLKNTQLLILFLDTVLKWTCRITVSVLVS